MPSPFSANDIEELYFVAHNTWRIVPEQVVHLCAKLFPLLSAGRVHNCEKNLFSFSCYHQSSDCCLMASVSILLLYNLAIASSIVFYATVYLWHSASSAVAINGFKLYFFAFVNNLHYNCFIK